MTNNYGYIYKTTDIKNGRVYIGQKKGNFNPKYFGSGTLIKKVINSEGLNNLKLELVVYGLTKEELNDLEKKYIAMYRELFGLDNLYNITKGGNGGGFSNKHHKIETKRKIGNSVKLKSAAPEIQEKLHRKKGSPSQNHRDNLSKAMRKKRKPCSEETKEKLRLVNKQLEVIAKGQATRRLNHNGKYFSEEGLKNKSEKMRGRKRIGGFTGKKHKYETIQKMREKAVGRKFSKETIIKRVETLKRNREHFKNLRIKEKDIDGKIEVSR